MTSPTSRQQLCWLHLSDFHLKATEQWSQDVVLHSLLTDVSNRYSNHDPIDFVFVTGDLAFSGKYEEYLIVEDFLNQLLKNTGVPADRLLIVPGNHDINRDMEVDAFYGAKCILKNSIEVDRFLGDEARRRTLFRRQSAFREFANRLCKRNGYSEVSYQHSVQYDLHGVNISIFLIDSSWISEGGDSDSHAILVGERQLIDLSAGLPRPTLAIGLMHHPLDWLAPFEHTPIKNLLAEHCHLLFRGHVHEDSIETIAQSGNQMKVFTAGASYESRLSANCYGYGSIDLRTGDGECIVRKYRNDTKTWEKQEPTSWTLTDQHHFSLEFDDIINALSSHVSPYPKYLSCLVAQKATEIPVLHDEQVVFLSFTDPMASATSVAQSIRRLRFLIHWRDCWQQNLWRDAINHTLDLYSSGITEFENCDEARVFLSNREDQCTKTLQFTHDRNAEIGRGNESFFQALKLASSGATELAVTILNRMLDQEALPDVEALTVLRALTKVHLAEGNSSESLETSNRLLLFAEASGDDYLLAATCSLNARNYEHAGKHLERARSLGVPFTKLKGIATRVAGLTGDAYLMTRLGNCDV